MKQRILRAAAVVGIALATTAGTALPAGAAAQAPRGPAVAGADASHLQAASVISDNWSGYVASRPSGFFTSVSARFGLGHATSCTGSSSSPAVGVSLDGYTDDTYESADMVDSCSSTHLVHWQPCIGICPPPGPQAPTGDPGDTMTTTVTALGTNEFEGVITDLTKGWTVSSEFAMPGAERSSAEALVQNMGSPMNNFGTVTFASVTVNGSESLQALNPTEITMESEGGEFLSMPSAIQSSGGFSVTWYNAGP